MNLLNPYFWGALALALLMSFFGGCHIQKGRDADKLASKDSALASAATALRGSAQALREVNDEAQKRIRSAADQAKASKEAASVLLKARELHEQKYEAEKVEWKKAKRKPGCAELLEADLVKVCGVKPR